MTSTRPAFAMLPENRVEQIIDEAFTVLSDIGVHVECEPAIELLHGAGAGIADDRGRVFMPRDLVERCLATVPATFTLYDRDGTEAAVVGGDGLVFDPGSAATTVYDYDAGRIRAPLTRDVVDFVRLTDRLDHFAVQSTGVVPSDVPEQLADRFRLLLALAFGRKPVITGTFTVEAFATMRDMLVAVRGSAEALRDKPLAMFDCCPSPPLAWSHLTCQALMDCAEAGIPAETVSMPLAGATGPVTLSGSLVQHAAESLSGVVIHQLAGPGSPLVYGGAAAVFDMRRGTTPMGAVETMMIDSGYAQIGKRLGLPVHAYMGLSDAKQPDYQAGFESAMGTVLAALAGVNVVSGPGMLYYVNCQSMEKLVLDHEVCAMARRLIDGVSFREDTAGLDVLRENATGRDFLRTQHTRRHFRDEVHYPGEVVDRGGIGDWESAGCPTAAARAHEAVARLLDGADAYDESLARRLEEIFAGDLAGADVGEMPRWRPDR